MGRPSARSLVNGVIGDYLVATDNELATPMMLLRRPDEPLKMVDFIKELKAKQNSNKSEEEEDEKPFVICILLHGLVCDEHCWAFEEENQQKKNSTKDEDDGKKTVDYGTLLERDIPNCISLHLRYNTGLHISTNGKQFNEMMQGFLQSLTVEAGIIQEVEINLICHSMGGLLARSATQYALRQQSSWIYSISRIIFLGTPHQGSYWECAGNVLTCALDSIQYTRMAARLAKLRSPGIKDLRYGYTLEEDWNTTDATTTVSTTSDNNYAEDSGAQQEQEQQEPQEAAVVDQDLWLTNTRKPGQEQLLQWVAYHTVTGTVMSDPQHPLSLLLGDGLVSKTSAQGRSAEPGHALSFPSTREFPGIHHNALQCSPAVYKQLLEWIRDTPVDKTAPPEWTVLPKSSDDHDRKEEQQQQQTDSASGGGLVLLDTAANANNNNSNEEDDDKNEEEEEEQNEEFTVVVGPFRVSIRSSITASDIASVVDDEEDDDNNNMPVPVGQRFAPYRGATSLVQDAVEAGVTTIEQVQMDITDDVYRVVKTYLTPSMALPIVTSIQDLHTGVVSSVYSSIRYVNNGTAETVKYAFQTMDSLEWMTWKMTRYLRNKNQTAGTTTPTINNNSNNDRM